jgi:hypothetical protein
LFKDPKYSFEDKTNNGFTHTAKNNPQNSLSNLKKQNPFSVLKRKLII